MLSKCSRSTDKSFFSSFSKCKIFILNFYKTPVIKLSDILSCSDFIDTFDSLDSNRKNQLTNLLLLSKHKNIEHDNIEKAVEKSLSSPENKRVFFAKVLPGYNFKVCNEFDSTWNMFENGYVNF